MDDFANKITPTSGMKGGGDENAMSRFWDRGWTSIKFANTVLSYVDQVQSLDEKYVTNTKDVLIFTALMATIIRHYYSVTFPW